MLDTLDYTDSFISGSAALWTMCDFDWFPNDIDIYTTPEGITHLRSTFEQRFGFSVNNIASSYYSSQVNIQSVLWLTKDSLCVNLIVVKGTNAAAALFYFHSTVVMNFINGHAIYCAYPDLTLRKKSRPSPNMLLAESTLQRTRTFNAIAKYRQRGVTFSDELGFTTHTCGTDGNCPMTTRTLHDGIGILTALPTRTTRALNPRDVIDGMHSVRWLLGGRGCQIANRSTFDPRTLTSVTSIRIDDDRAGKLYPSKILEHGLTRNLIRNRTGGKQLNNER
ncbi:hypothetical protein DFH06DRAFT_1022341 [Mycena polygramma]|nr:hypothetical protein DFH06DRAFT_1022341 [Mycena polygramma]